MSATLTKTAVRAANRKIRALRAERKRWLRGEYLHWGTPWCSGPGSPYHAEAVDGSDICEGCCTRLWIAGRVVPISEEIRRLEGLLAPVVQVTLW
jgi:hypothetical protein